MVLQSLETLTGTPISTIKYWQCESCSMHQLPRNRERMQGKAKLRDCTSLLFLPGAVELEGAEADGAGDRCWRACWIDAGMLEAFIADCTSL